MSLLLTAFFRSRRTLPVGLAVAGLFGGMSRAQVSESYVFGGDSIFARERIQVVYTQADLLAMGLAAGDSIDTLCFAFTQRYSTMAYANVSISMYVTSPGFAFPVSLTGWAPGITGAPSPSFAGTVNLSVPGPYFVPPGGGTLDLPFTKPYVWPGTTFDLVIDICWEASGPMPSDPTAATLLNVRKTARVRATASNPVGGCQLTPATAGAVRNASFWRPDICLKAKPAPTAVPAVSGPVALRIVSVAADGGSLIVGLACGEGGRCDCRITDVAGRVVAERSVPVHHGHNDVRFGQPLKAGYYIIRIRSGKSVAGATFVR